jgi:SAM-dependent methyltransferase
MQSFVDGYLGRLRDTPLRVLDVGCQIVMEGHRTYRTLFDSPQWEFVGLDVEAGLNVDVAVAHPYDWAEIDADSFDVVISGQALEHVPKFWLTAFEVTRALKPGGITMLMAPSGGFEHRYPVDCWRFYADGMAAIAEHAGCEIVECGTDWDSKPWADSYLVMRKPQWTEAERSSFLLRRELQLRAAFPGRADIEAKPTPEAATSVLASVAGGAITSRTEVLPDKVAMAHMGHGADAPSSPLPAPEITWRQVAKKFAGHRGLAAYRRIRHRA